VDARLDKDAQAGVLRLVDHTDLADAQLFDDTVMRDGLRDHEEGPRPMNVDVSATGAKST
jgi:hypothetical protein